MSPDTVSSLFPDRPIRPLPKRRLRERLSPEVAQSIKYPPSTHDTVPLFYYPPYSAKEEGGSSGLADSAARLQHNRRSNLGAGLGSLRNGAGPGLSEEDEATVRGTPAARTPPEIFSRAARNPSRPDRPRSAEPKPPPSATSSVDGYDCFENTNNKKKRKIPSAGDSAINSTHSLNNDISSLAISAGGQSPTSEVHGDRLIHGTSGYVAHVSTNAGFSGPGRGRLGRSRNGRSPLRALSDGNNAWPARSSKAGVSPWPSPHEGGGIISSAIANAEKLPSQGQENVSLLQQHSESTPASTQFTFTCDSQVPGTVQWPGHPNKHGTATQMGGVASKLPNGVGHDISTKSGGAKSGHSRRKSRRRLEQELNIAARRRRQLAAESYYHHSPKGDDIWICEFCEYESIFGEPPRILIRDYEMKDRRHRQEEADRKRLLEKAKAKARKGKKNGKALNKSSHGAQHTCDQGAAEDAGDQQAPHMHQGQSHSTQSEGDAYEENYDDGLAGQTLGAHPAAGEGLVEAHYSGAKT